MLIKLLNLYFFVILLVKVHSNEAKNVSDDIVKHFLIDKNCLDVNGTSNIVTKEETNITIHVRSQGDFINYAACTVRSPTGKIRNFLDFSKLNQQALLETKITKSMNGLWNCTFLTKRDAEDLLKQIKVQNQTHTYSPVLPVSCYFNITFQEPVNNGTANELSIFQKDPNLWIYITTGCLLIVVILAQTGVIIYFKMKAQKRTRMDTLSLKLRSNSNSGSDEKRYSSMPSRKNKISRLFGKDNQNKGSGIYETLEEVHGGQNPPTPPVENIPTLRKNSEVDIRKRPPLPLPKESTDDDVKVKPTKNFPFPPKMSIGEESVPTTIVPRPLKNKPEPKVKPGKPLPPLAEKLPPKPVVTGNLRNNPGPAIVASELDNIFKKRQNAPTASTSAVQPPPAPAPKTSPSKMKKDNAHSPYKKNPEPPNKPQPPPPQKPSMNRVPQPIPNPEPSKPIAASPAKKPLPPLPSPPLPSPPLPTPNLPPHPQVSKLPAPHLPPQRPEPPVQSTPLLPDTQEPVYEEYDEPVYNSDEEWTYEALQKYNIYSA